MYEHKIIDVYDAFKEIGLAASRSSLGETSIDRINSVEVIDILKNMPAIDVELIIRCKDCKYASANSFLKAEGKALCRYWSLKAEKSLEVQQDDYCCHAERKE